MCLVSHGVLAGLLKWKEAGCVGGVVQDRTIGRSSGCSRHDDEASTVKVTHRESHGDSKGGKETRLEGKVSEQKGEKWKRGGSGT